jgi:hypothetical protein
LEHSFRMDSTQTLRTFSGSIFQCSAGGVESVHRIPSIEIVTEDIYVTLKIRAISFCAELLETQFSHGLDPNLTNVQRKYFRMFGGMGRVGPLHPINRNCHRGHIRDSENSVNFILRGTAWNTVYAWIGPKPLERSAEVISYVRRDGSSRSTASQQ